VDPQTAHRGLLQRRQERRQLVAEQRLHAGLERQRRVLPAITTVISPRAVRPSNSSASAESDPRCVASNRLVRSTHTHASRSPSTSAASRRSFATRCGDSNRISVWGASTSASRKRLRGPGLRGGKPLKVKLDGGRPETVRAASAALGPGTGTTGKPRSTTSRSVRYP